MGTQPREADRIQCLECGRWFRALPTHLIRTHGMTDEDYRLKFLVPVGVPLVCVEWSERQSVLQSSRDTSQQLTARGPSAGFRHRESVRTRRKGDYARLAEAGRTVAASVDRTAARREMLRPYPVTVEQAVSRLGCSRQAAYTFLSFAVASGYLRRVGRGVYEEATHAN